MPTIFRGSLRGGIIPFFYQDVEETTFFEKNIAPKKGYLQQYKLINKIGNTEIGFFIKCRDGKTYAKLIRQDYTYHKGNWCKDEDCKSPLMVEIGYAFHCLYQTNGSRNLAYMPMNFSLEDFLEGNEPY